MKHLLNGVAIAATLVIAASAWAQAPMTPDAGKKASGGAGRDVGRIAPATTAPAAAAPAAGAPMHAQRHHRAMHHMAHHGHMHMGAGDAATDQLNREELARLQGGGMPAPAPAPEGGAAQGGPRPSGK
jgi:hypothetical protein